MGPGLFRDQRVKESRLRRAHRTQAVRFHTVVLRNSVQMPVLLPACLKFPICKKRTIYHLHHEMALRSKIPAVQHMAECLEHEKRIIS